LIHVPEDAVMRTHELLRQRLELAHRWYEGMVNPLSGMLEYLYIPGAAARVREKAPIRDIASVWDAEVLGDFLDSKELRPLIERSLRHYDGYLVEREGCLILDSHQLEEPSSIAHSAFMILALLHAPPPPRTRQIAALAAGIRRQQRTDGSYKICFEDLPDYGEELYSGEAMLALMEAYRRFGEKGYLHSVERAFSFYDAQYFGRGRVAEDILVFFANWQSQACRLLFASSRDAVLKQGVAKYLYRMHDQIIRQGFYQSVKRHPARHVSVEVACALEGLNDAYALARASNDRRTERYRDRICEGLAYLLRVQCAHDGTERERGGFGMSLDDRAQRIDITGHAVSAFLKSIQNDIECGFRPEQ
jgi:hypothetical protein